MDRKTFSGLLLLSLWVPFMVSFAEIPQKIRIHTSRGVVGIYPKGLVFEVQPYGADGAVSVTSVDDEHFSEPVAYKEKIDTWEIDYQGGIKVRLQLQGERIHVKISPQSDKIIRWPSIEESPALKAYIIPDGEGLYVPVSGGASISFIPAFSVEAPILPVFGYLYKDFSLSMLIHTPFRMSFRYDPHSRSKARFQYDFRQRDAQDGYEVSFSLSEPELLAPAKIFKKFLKESGQYKTLLEKSRSTPDIEKLGGAIHAYLWGDGRSTEILDKLKALGISGIWLGYEERAPNSTAKNQRQKDFYVDRKFVTLAKQLGYLVGPYDSWNTAQTPSKADAYNTDFGHDFLSWGCSRKGNGKIHAGFAGRGCQVCMSALDRSGNSVVYSRFERFKNSGVNSYFLDLHATNDLTDCYDPSHPQTIFDVLRIRRKHLEYLSGQGVVVGSETAGHWAMPFLAFSHGSMGVLYDLHWARDKKKVGGWWPGKRPQIFFKTIDADSVYAKRYDPAYRIPLWQAVFHESCVSTDRWEIPLTKYGNLYRDRFLLEFLYGVPSMWSLDVKAVKDFGHILKQLARDFTPFHQAVMYEPLTDFRFLTDDRSVQSTRFGGIARVTANFRKEVFQDIPPKSLKIEWLNTGQVKYVTPEALFFDKNQT